MFDLFIKNGYVYIDGEFRNVNIGITGEKISYLGPEEYSANEVIDAKNRKIIPGLIDPHVHFDLYCGTITSRDNFYYGSKSAIYGGVTTIVDFLDPSRNAKELEETFNVRKKQAENCNVDYHFHACVREPDGDLEEYVLKMKQLGINTIKLFTTYSETHRRTYDKDIIELLKLSKKYDFLVLAHIENDEMINRDESLTYESLSEARNSESETSEAIKLCQYASETGGNLYMVHCSSGNTIERIKKEYKQYLNKNIFVESCPQYFVFNNSVLKGNQGYLFTFAPPLRSEEERALLIKNFNNIYTIGTDHCSFNIADKKGHTYLKGMPLGVGGIETIFIVMYKMFGDSVIDKMCKNVAKIERFTGKSGILVGNYADLVILRSGLYKIGKPHGNVDYSIYEGITSNIKVESTIIRGQFALREGKFIRHKGEMLNCEKGKKR